MVADIELRNGTAVTAGNGVLLQTDGLVVANLAIDNIVISGDIRSDARSTANAYLRNNAGLTAR